MARQDHTMNNHVIMLIVFSEKEQIQQAEQSNNRGLTYMYKMSTKTFTCLCGCSEIIG